MKVVQGTSKGVRKNNMNLGTGEGVSLFVSERECKQKAENNSTQTSEYEQNQKSQRNGIETEEKIVKPIQLKTSQFN